MAESPWDLAILGAGCAGLSLASRLAGSGVRCCLIDPRPDPAQDRAFDRHWGYWRIEPHPFEHLEIARWSRWKLRFGGQERTFSSTRYPYCLIPSEAFVGEAMGRIRAAENITLVVSHVESARSSLEKPPAGSKPAGGCTAPNQVDWRLVRSTVAGGVVRAGGGFEVRLQDGASLTALRIADSRPPVLTGPPKQILLRQHFLGQWVRLPEGRFDPEVATLMDFDLDQSQGIHFAYLLPLAPDHALVMDTFFGAAPLVVELYRRNIAAYLRERFGVQRFEVEREELGVIPMTTQQFPVQPAPGWFRIGAAGGAVKPSSGYGFTAIQRQADWVASKLLPGSATGAPPPQEGREGSRPRPISIEWLDRILLCRMHDDPASIPKMMFRLFERVEPDALIRFLSDRPAPPDYLAVIRAMPPLPMIRTALRRMPQWLHS